MPKRKPTAFEGCCFAFDGVLREDVFTVFVESCGFLCHSISSSRIYILKNALFLGNGHGSPFPTVLVVNVVYIAGQPPPSVDRWDSLSVIWLGHPGGVGRRQLER